MKKLSIALLVAVACANFKTFGGGGTKEQAQAHEAKVQKDNKERQQKQEKKDRDLAEQLHKQEHLDADERAAKAMHAFYNKTSGASTTSLTTAGKDTGVTKVCAALPKVDETMDTKHSKSPRHMDMKIEVVFAKGANKVKLAHAAVQNVRSQANSTSFSG